MKEKETIYTINSFRTVQTSPDDWTTYPVSVQLNDNMSVLDIKIAFSKIFGCGVEEVDLRGMKIGILFEI